jgi:hypothetical protein
VQSVAFDGALLMQRVAAHAQSTGVAPSPANRIEARAHSPQPYAHTRHTRYLDDRAYAQLLQHACHVLARHAACCAGVGGQEGDLAPQQQQRLKVLLVYLPGFRVQRLNSRV